MPRVTVEILEGRTPDQKRALIREIANSVINVYKVPAKGVAIRIQEVKFTDLGTGTESYWDFALHDGKVLYGSSGDPRITVTCTERSLDEKKELVKQITDKVSEILGVPASDVKIFINEMKKDQFAIGGKLICDK